MNLWEVLWAEDYRDQMGCWTSANTGGTAYKPVSTEFYATFLLSDT